MNSSTNRSYRWSGMVGGRLCGERPRRLLRSNRSPRWLRRPGAPGHSLHCTRPTSYDATGIAPLGHEVSVGVVIVLRKERPLSAVPPLRQMMRETRGDDTSDPRHGSILQTSPPRQGNVNRYGVPRIVIRDQPPGSTSNEPQAELGLPSLPCRAAATPVRAQSRGPVTSARDGIGKSRL